MSAYTTGLLIVGVPVIIWLIIRAVRKMRDITVRIREVREELAANPQAAAQAMAEIMAREQSNKKPPKSKNR